MTAWARAGRRNWPTFLLALAAREQPQATLLALQTLFRQEVGARLFTVMTFDAPTGLSQRVHSSHPEEYPVSGVKPLSQGLWSRTVIDERKTFVANSIEAIAEVFPDHELIRSLGCELVAQSPRRLRRCGDRHGELSRRARLLHAGARRQGRRPCALRRDGADCRRSVAPEPVERRASFRTPYGGGGLAWGVRPCRCD